MASAHSIFVVGRGRVLPPQRRWLAVSGSARVPASLIHRQPEGSVIDQACAEIRFPRDYLEHHPASYAGRLAPAAP